MKIVYIVGNGFDINLGLKTKYNQFYEYYKEIDSSSERILKLKENINNDYKNWSDLELALGEYTSNLNSLNEFDEVFEDILENLANYLQIEEDKFELNNIDIDKFLDFLCFPEKSLLARDKNDINTYKTNWSSQNWLVNIITLNYTNILDKIIDNRTDNYKIGTNNKSSIYLNGLEHIHGYINDRMIMGVNDITQIKNSSLHNNRDVLEAIVKSQCNKAHKHTIDDKCIAQISNANLICIFGSSIGETDNFWWELIGDKLKNNVCRLIIFARCEDISLIKGYKKERKVREYKELFLSKINLTEKEKSIIENNIYVGINTDFFNINN